MIIRTLGFFAALLLLSSPAWAITSPGCSYKPLGYQQATSLGSSSALPSIPTTASVAVLEVNSAGTSIRWRDDGTAPTASIGMELLPGAQLTYSGDLTAFKMIQTAASATVNVSYYQCTG